MKTPEEISKDIRDDYFRRYGSWVEGGMNEESLNTLIVGAVSPLCQRIDALKGALEFLWVISIRKDGETITEADIARLRAILGD